MHVASALAIPIFLRGNRVTITTRDSLKIYNCAKSKVPRTTFAGDLRSCQLRYPFVSEVESFRSLPTSHLPFRSFRWSLAKLKSKSGSKAEAITRLKTQLRPHSSSAWPAEPAYPLVAGVAVPPLHRSDKERCCSRF